MADGNWRSIAEGITAKIESGEWAPGTRLPSGDAMARDLGVNRNVVHRAFEELQRRGLVIRRQGSGSVVAEQANRKSGRIALLVDGYSAVHNFPSGDLLRGIQDCIGDDATLVIADSKHDPVLEARQLRRLVQEVDGILIYACSPERSGPIAAIVEDDYPLVAIDRLPIGVNMDATITDNRGAVADVIRGLVEAGHRRIGFLGLYKETFSSVMERHQGYRDGMIEAGLDPDELVRWLPDGCDTQSRMFERLVRDTILGLRHEDRPVTAIFCTEDCLGCAAVVACENLGISYPTELEIATFIDWHPMTLRKPWNVRRIVQRKYELGHAAAGLLLDRIASPKRPHKTVLIGVEIIPADADFSEAASPTVAEPT